MPINVCFISSRSANVNGNVVWIDGSNGRLIEFLSAKIPGLNLATFTDPNIDSTKYNLKISMNKVYPLPFPFSYMGGLRNTFKVRKILKQIESENDLLIIQLPFISFYALKVIKKPVIYHLCANVLTASINPVKYKGFSKLAANLYAKFIHRTHHHLFNNNRNSVITNGDELGHLYSKYNPRVVVSSSISDRDTLLPEQINNKNKKSLLFIGRPSLEKGFNLLLRTFHDLSKNYQLNLSIIGFDHSDFKELSPAMNIEFREVIDKIEFKGYLSWGNEFRSICQDSLALILPSLSEGTPRVLLEAMSQGCPVIASRVGGIPTIIKDKHNGLLFEPGNSSDLRNCIEKIMMNENGLRNELIENGLKTARLNTLEYFGNHFLELIKKYE